MRARLCCSLEHTWTQALTRHFQQTKARDAAHLDAGAIGFQLVLEALFNGSVVLALVHIDKVDDDQTREVAQTHLTRNFIRCFKVGFQRCLFDRPFFGRAARVHVDRNQSLSDTDHDITARRKLNGRVEHTSEVTLNLIARKERQLVVIGFNVLRMRRHDHFHEVFCRTVACVTRNDHFVDLFGIEVADRAFDKVTLFVDLRRRCRLQRQFADLFPQALQVFVVALDLSLCTLRARSANDQACTIWHIHLSRDFFELLAVDGIGDFAADATTTRCVRHENTVTASKRQIGR